MMKQCTLVTYDVAAKLTLLRRVATHQRVFEGLNLLITQLSMYSRFSSNSEAPASELLKNHEEMFLRY